MAVNVNCPTIVRTTPYVGECLVVLIRFIHVVAEFAQTCAQWVLRSTRKQMDNTDLTRSKSRVMMIVELTLTFNQQV